MSDPNHMHEFIPSRRGTCKQIIGSAICGQPIEFTPHQRHAEQVTGVTPDYLRGYDDGCRDAAENIKRNKPLKSAPMPNVMEIVTKILEVAEIQEENSADNTGMVYMPEVEEWGVIVGMAKRIAEQPL